MRRCFSTLPYGRWILHRLLYIISTVAICYVFIGYSEAVWNFIDSAVGDSQQPYVDSQQFKNNYSVIPTQPPPVIPPPADTMELWVPPLEPDNVQERFKERNKVVKDQCGSMGYPDFKQSNMYYFPNLRATWIPVFGADSARWKMYFIDQYASKRSGRANDQYNLGLLSKYLLQYRTVIEGTGRKSRHFTKEPDESVRFTVIRHPLSRLITHFRKPQLERSELAALKDQWILPTILLGRTDPSWTDEQKEKFELELCDWIDGKLTPQQSPNNPLLSAPTFPEFVRFIVDAADKGDDRAYNVHWRPISEWLDICQNDIDIIVKMEKVESEIPVLLEKLHITSHQEYFLADRADDINIEYYMGQLSKQDQEKINAFYDMDYRIFGYQTVIFNSN
eukprot:sb/3465506/